MQTALDALLMRRNVSPACRPFGPDWPAETCGSWQLAHSTRGCAFCHGADGTGKNWIGQFMEPKARDLTRYSRATLPPGRFAEVVRHGIEGSSMPAWSGVLRPDEVDAVVAYASRAFLQPHPTSAEPPVSVAPSMAPSPSSGPDADSRNREPALVWRRE